MALFVRLVADGSSAEVLICYNAYMSRAHAQSLPVNRRELSFYFLFGTILLFLASIAIAGAWMLFSSSSNWVSIGNIDQFPASEYPYRAEIDGTEHGAWVVNIDGNVMLFHRHSTAMYEGEVCPIAWNGANMRFEGPCWGSKFRLDGTLLEAPARRDLDRYAFKIYRGEILVDNSSLILGTCRDIPNSIRSGYFWEEPGEPPICSDAWQG